MSAPPQPETNAAALARELAGVRAQLQAEMQAHELTRREGALTDEEREFVIWALGFVEGAALEQHDDRTAYRANFIASKLKTPANDEAAPPPKRQGGS